MLSVITTINGFETVHKAVASAKEVSSLDTTALLAFICLVLFSYIVYLLRQERTADRAWQEIRMLDALAKEKLASSVESLSKDVSEMKILLSLLKRGA